MSHLEPITRPYFQPRQMVTAADLQAGVGFLVERIRRHNRYLHGCGVACGLEVSVEPVFQPTTQQLSLIVQVQPGQAISPQGDAIHVPVFYSETFDSALVVPSNESFRNSLWSIFQAGLGGGLSVLLRHTTTGSQPCPMLPEICGPEGTPMANTRYRDGYRIDLATFRPAACATPLVTTPGSVIDELLRHDTAQTGVRLADFMHCPPDTDEPWLILATVDLERIDDLTMGFETHYRLRMLLPSTRLLLDLLRCFPDAPRIDSATITRSPNSRWHRVTVTGKGFTPFQRLSIDDPQMSAFVETYGVTDTSLPFWYYVPPDLAPGLRTFSIITQFDTLESGRCGVMLDVQQPVFPTYPYGYSYGYGNGSLTIGGGNL
jgi:hypothetical protein